MGRARGDPPLSARMARFGASMFAAGALIVAVSGIPPWSTATSRGVLVLVCVCALSAAGLLLLIGPRLPVNAFQVFTLLGTGLITVLGLVGGEGITAYSALYVWASLFAFTFYSFRAALAQVVVIVGAAAALFAMRPATPDRVVHWLLLSGSVVVAGVWVHRLVAQLRARAAQLGETADRLEARERSFRTLFESNPQPMWVYDARTLVLLAVNDAAVAHYGHSRQAFLGMRVSDVTVPEPPPSAPAGVEEAGVSRAAHHRLRDGSVIEVEVASHALEFEGSPGILALVRDVTEQRRTERLRVLQAAVARLLAEATTVEDGAREVLACAGGAIGGEAGTVWLVDGGGERLEPVVGWTAGAAPGDAGARRHDVGRGEGLAGRVWASAAPQATGPPGPDGADPAARSDGAAAPGVGGGIAFPIVNGAEVIGVIELRCRDRCELTTDVRGVMGGIGGQLGQFLARRQAQEALRDSERSFRMLFAVNPHPMWVWDAETYYFLAVNDAAVEHYGYARDEFLAMRVIDLRPPEDVPRFVVESAKVRSDRRHLAGEYRHRVKGGRIIDVEITARLIEFGGRPANLVLVKDITERKELERELRHQAFHDALTGLANRGLFVDRADHVLSRQDRRDPCAAVLLLDLDNFKTVNDSLGHAVGDRLLCAVARRLGEAVRPGDTVARLGGDEFAVLLEDLPADAAAVDLAERILAELRRPFLLGDREVIVGASIGIALSRAGATAERLLRDADVAMYSAKAQGKACCRVFSQSMHTAVTERLAMEQDLRAALHRGELSVVYQPQVEVATGRLVGVEALLRWRRGGQGPVAPDEFVPVAEDIGLIGVLDEWVLAQACGDVRLWQREGLPPLSLAVNISGRELETPGLVDRVHRALETSGLAPTRLELELTESAAVRQSPSALAHLIELRSLGVSIAIDDFGTGYSVLSRLRDFPLDRVKIDKSFIGGVHRATDDAPIVAAMIAMGHGLGLEVVAEGVETPEQLSFLRRHGCDIVQGHLIGRPRPAAELSGLLAVRRSVAAPTERLDLVNVLDAVSEVVSAEPGLDDLCRALLRELARVAGVEVCVHLERSRADATLRVRHAHGVGWGLSREGSTLAAGDPPAATRALGLAAHLAVPVVAGHDSRGWLIAGNRSTRPLAEGLERVMELVAGLIASETEHQLGAAAGVTAAPGLR